MSTSGPSRRFRLTNGRMDLEDGVTTNQEEITSLAASADLNSSNVLQNDSDVLESVSIETGSGKRQDNPVTDTPIHPAILHWKSHEYAVGYSEYMTWEDEKNEGCMGFFSSRFFLKLSAYAFSNDCIKAERIGNMAVFGDKHLYMVGPFWPCLIFFTYPLIFAVSGWCYYAVVSEFNIISQIAWVIMTISLIASLALTAFRNPGLWKRRREREDEAWIWNEQGFTWRPRGAYFDSECQVVIEHFDHVCPWTGTGMHEVMTLNLLAMLNLFYITAIGKRNLASFHTFVALVFLNLIVDIMLLSGAGF